MITDTNQRIRIINKHQHCALPLIPSVCQLYPGCQEEDVESLWALKTPCCHAYHLLNSYPSACSCTPPLWKITPDLMDASLSSLQGLLWHALNSVHVALPQFVWLNTTADLLASVKTASVFDEKVISCWTRQQLRAMSMICDITSSLDVNPGPVFSVHACDVETRSLRCTNTENGREGGDVLCPTGGKE